MHAISMEWFIWNESINSSVVKIQSTRKKFINFRVAMRIAYSLRQLDDNQSDDIFMPDFYFHDWWIKWTAQSHRNFTAFFGKDKTDGGNLISALEHINWTIKKSSKQ